MSSGYGFTEDTARRIVRVVKAVEGDTTEPTRIGPMLGGSTMSVVRVTTVGSPLSTGQRVDYHAGTNLLVDQNEVKIKEVNGATLALGQKYMGQFSGYDIDGKPVFIVDLAGVVGTATIEVVTDVSINTKAELSVSTVFLSGADYDNAVVRQFLALSDVNPITYTGNQGRVVKVNDGGTGLTFGAIGEGPIYTTFIALSDTPAEYGKTNTYKTLTVSSGNNGVAFSSNNVTTTNSLTGGGNPNAPTWTALKLVNDETSPGNNKFYGTTSTGVRGWRTYTLSVASDFPESYTGAAGKFLKVNAAGNAVEFSAVDISAMLSAIADLTARVNALEAP